jgi:hypothetical protein
MDRRGQWQDVIRLVRGLRGSVPMQMELAIRFEYGTVVPWVTRVDGDRPQAAAGPDQILFAAPVDFRGEDVKTRADFGSKKVNRSVHLNLVSFLWCPPETIRCGSGR